MSNYTSLKELPEKPKRAATAFFAFKSDIYDKVK